MNFLVSVGTAEMERTPATEEFWAVYMAAAKLMHDRYTVVQMGDTPEMAIERRS
jgi:hypothetical protein